VAARQAQHRHPAFAGRRCEGEDGAGKRAHGLGRSAIAEASRDRAS
jgi:hypothetical protein